MLFIELTVELAAEVFKLPLVEPLVLELLKVEVEVDPLAVEVEVLPLSEVEALLILVELVLLLFD